METEYKTTTLKDLLNGKDSNIPVQLNAIPRGITQDGKNYLITILSNEGFHLYAVGKEDYRNAKEAILKTASEENLPISFKGIYEEDGKMIFKIHSFCLDKLVGQFEKDWKYPSFY